VQLLWISGGPGKGKTILSIYLTQELEQERQTIYYFCASDNHERNNAASLLRGLIWHVTDKHLQLAEHLLDDFDDSKKTQHAIESPEVLWNIFAKLVQDARLGATFCVLDGLDELDEDSRIWLVAKLLSIARTTKLNQLKLVILSRHVLGLEEITRVNLDLENDARSNQDIQLFVKDRVDALVKRHRLTQRFGRKIEQTLMQRAEGTFLWIGFVMVELFRKETPTQIRTSLTTLPKGLPGIYGRMLLQMDPDFRSTGVVLLRWVTMAVSPLSLAELAAATNTQPLDDVDVEQAIRDRVKMCGPLLKIREGHVSLVHQSAKEYLTRHGIDQDTTLEMFRFSPEEVHLEVASRCIDCIGQSRMRHQLVMQWQLPVSVFGDPDPEYSPLIWYAVYNWPQHARLASTLAEHLISNNELFEDGSILRHRWWELYQERGPYDMTVKEPALHIACYLGIDVWVQHILASPAVRTNLRDEDGRTPLSWAATYGYEAVVKSMLEIGSVEVDLEDNQGRTPLSRAVERGHEAVIKLLLETREVNVNSKDVDGRTPLSYAVQDRDETTIKLLLSTGDIDADLKDEDAQSPLSWAIRYGHEKAVRLLLGTGNVDVNLRDDYDHTPLSCAVDNGDEALVKLLLETTEVDVDSKAPNGCTPLSLAVANGCEAVVKLLLETGKVDADSRDSHNQSLLLWAARYRHSRVLQLLLKSGGIDVDSRDRYGRTPLSWAAEDGDEAVVKLLLETGKVDVDSKDVDGRTPTSYTVEYGHERVLRLLLGVGKVDTNLRDNDKRIDVDSRDNYDRTPLSWAARYGHRMVLHLLLETGGIDVDSRDRYGRTPLSWAAEDGDEAVVKLLLETGKVDVDSKDMSGRTPLSQALKHGHEATLYLLLKNSRYSSDWRRKYYQSLLSGYQSGERILQPSTTAWAPSVARLCQTLISGSRQDSYSYEESQPKLPLSSTPSPIPIPVLSHTSALRQVFSYVCQPRHWAEKIPLGLNGHHLRSHFLGDRHS
jgi:ankyrin repeat protein